MLTDEVKIKVHAGKGGNGVVAFNKTKMSLGPTGGRGGNGGNVYFQGVSDLTALNKYKQKRDYYAPDGNNGARDKSTGHDGKDIILIVPIGSVLKNLGTEESFEITQVGQKIRLKPKKFADAFDMFLKDQIAVIESIEEDFEGKKHFSVVLEKDEGRDFGFDKFIGHRFFFGEDELEIL